MAGNAVGVRRTGDRSRWNTSRPLRRAARLAGMDGNPLRRGIDRAEQVFWLLLAVAFLIAVPLLVPMAGGATRASNMRLVDAERSWREVSAVVLTAAPARMNGFSASETVWVYGRWRTPAGARRTGLVPAAPGTPAGASVKVWVDQRGAVTGQGPVTADIVTFRVILIEVMTAIGLSLTGVGLGWLVRWAMDRRRLACWAIEWACFGPRWSARHLSEGA
jgi:hypothetical protein